MYGLQITAVTLRPMGKEARTYQTIWDPQKRAGETGPLVLSLYAPLKVRHLHACTHMQTEIYRRVALYTTFKEAFSEA